MAKFFALWGVWGSSFSLRIFLCPFHRVEKNTSWNQVLWTLVVSIVIPGDSWYLRKAPFVSWFIFKIIDCWWFLVDFCPQGGEFLRFLSFLTCSNQVCVVFWCQPSSFVSPLHAQFLINAIEFNRFLMTFLYYSKCPHSVGPPYF